MVYYEKSWTVDELLKNTGLSSGSLSFLSTSLHFDIVLLNLLSYEALFEEKIFSINTHPQMNLEASHDRFIFPYINIK